MFDGVLLCLPGQVFRNAWDVTGATCNSDNDCYDGTCTTEGQAQFCTFPCSSDRDCSFFQSCIKSKRGGGFCAWNCDVAGTKSKCPGASTCFNVNNTDVNVCL